jgi:hypothetical protein
MGPRGSREDYTIDFMVEREIDHPSLLLEVNPATDMAHLSSKEFAIIDVKKPDEVEPTNQHAERLYGILIIGKCWRAVYVRTVIIVTISVFVLVC